MSSREGAPVQVNTPLIVWHGGVGGNDPIYSCDFLHTHHRSGVLATSGTDATIRVSGNSVYVLLFIYVLYVCVACVLFVCY